LALAGLSGVGEGTAMRVPVRGRSAAGFTLLELMVAVTVMAVMIAGAAMTLNSSWRQNQFMREEVAAIRAAEDKIAELRGMGLDGLKTAIVDSTLMTSFPVTLVRGHGARMGPSGGDEGQVIPILDEDPDETAYGVDGVDIDDNGTVATTTAGSIFPIDLNGDGDDTDDLSTSVGDMKLIPVVVVVRWESLAKGLTGRVQLLTVIGG
jgi:prepilin-type N-terminal cleavage/methylation domain-containing protein